MKKLLFIVLICIFSNQNYAQEETPLEYSAIIDLNGVSSTELKNRCLNWLGITFSDSKSILVPSSDDQIIAKPLIPYNPSVFTGSEQIKGTIKYTLQIQFKDNKFRYIFSDFFHEGNPHAKFQTTNFGLITTDVSYDKPIKGSTKAWKDKVWNDLKKQIDQHTLSLIESLKKEMTNPQTKTDNW